MPEPRRRVGRWAGLAAVVGVSALVVVMATRGGVPASGSLEAGVATPAVANPIDAPGGPVPGSASGGSDRDQAAQLVGAGRAQATEGHYAAAHALYQRAYALDPEPSTLFEVGRMEYLTGRCREARRTIQRLVAQSQGDPVREKAQELLGAIGRCD